MAKEIMIYGTLTYFILLSITTGFAFIFYKYIYTPHKINSVHCSYDELMRALNTIIDIQLTIYEKNIFNTKGSLTNANFDNYMDDIVNQILNSIPKTFYIHMNEYMNEGAVVTLICRVVRQWLTEKI